MHDTVWFEVQGTPSVFVASSVFDHAADAQARALGLPAVRRIFVPHPIQDATDDEMRRKADAIVDEVIAALTTAEGVGEEATDRSPAGGRSDRAGFRA